MQAHDLDRAYTSLAHAVHQAGANSELFLAMLSLKLITERDDVADIEQSIAGVLQALQISDGPHEKLLIEPNDSSSTA